MLVYLPVEFPDACSGCGVAFGPQEERLGVLVGRQAAPGEAVAGLGALCSPQAFHVRHGPPPGTPARVLGGAADAQRAPLYGPEHFVLVAELYRSALPEGSPTRAVAEALSVSRSTAAKWVAEARRRGHLSATRRGVPLA